MFLFSLSLFLFWSIFLAIDSNAQENGDDADAEGKSEEETKENKEEKPTTSENKTDDEKAKENDIFGRYIGKHASHVHAQYLAKSPAILHFYFS